MPSILMDSEANGPLLVFIPPDPEEARSSRRVKAAAVVAAGVVLALSVWVLWPSPRSADEWHAARLRDYASVGGPLEPTGDRAVSEPARQPPAPVAPARAAPPPSTPAPKAPSASPERRTEPTAPPRPRVSPLPDESPSPPGRPVPAEAPDAPPSMPVARTTPPESPSLGIEAAPSPPPMPPAPEPPGEIRSPVAPPPPPSAPRPSAPRSNGAWPRLEESRAVPEPTPVPAPTLVPAPAPMPVPAPSTPPIEPGEPERRPERPLVRGAPPAGSPGAAAAALASAAGAAPLGLASHLRRAATSHPLAPSQPLVAPPRPPRPVLERRIAETVSPAVVRVGGGGRGRGGVGFIVDPAGYIVTSHHVANSVEAVSVTLQDGRTLRGRIVARDPLANVAVLKVEAAGRLPALTLGDSKALRVGEPVMAVGRGSGQGADVAIGSIRATGAATGGNLATDLPGHADRAGGPVVNARGEAVAVATGGGARHGAAVPIDRVKPILAQLRSATGPLATATLSDR